MGMEWGGGWDLQSLTWATQLELALFEVNLDCHTRPLSFTPLPGEGGGMSLSAHTSPMLTAQAPDSCAHPLSLELQVCGLTAPHALQRMENGPSTTALA